MVKRKSHPASIRVVQVRILVGPMFVYGRATRLATGTGWKPVERENVLRVQLPLLPLWPVRCWFPETDCESVWQRFDSARSPPVHNVTSVLLESSQPPNLTHGVRILTLVLQRSLRNADVARLRKASSCKRNHAGANPVVGSLINALRVWRMHECLRSSRARFDSSVG